MSSKKICAVITFWGLLTLFWWWTPADMIPTLLLLAVCAWLSLDSLLAMTIVGNYFERLSARSYGTFHRQANWVLLALCVAFAAFIVVHG